MTVLPQLPLCVSMQIPISGIPPGRASLRMRPYRSVIVTER